MLNNNLKIEIQRTAKSIRADHKTRMPKDSVLVELNYRLPYVALNLPNGEEYFFQGEEASEILEEAVNAGNKFCVAPEDYLLYISQSW